MIYPTYTHLSARKGESLWPQGQVADAVAQWIARQTSSPAGKVDLKAVGSIPISVGYIFCRRIPASRIIPSCYRTQQSRKIPRPSVRSEVIHPRCPMLRQNTSPLQPITSPTACANSDITLRLPRKHLKRQGGGAAPPPMTFQESALATHQRTMKSVPTDARMLATAAIEMMQY